MREFRLKVVRELFTLMKVEAFCCWFLITIALNGMEASMWVLPLIYLINTEGGKRKKNHRKWSTRRCEARDDSCFAIIRT
jgi:hypothetical protein